MLLIGLTGRAGSGKSTVAAAIAARFPKGQAHVLSFAEPLKAMLAALFESVGDDPEEWGKEDPCPLLLGKSRRHAMQTLGTEWGRDCIGPEFWVRLAQARIARLREAAIETERRKSPFTRFRKGTAPFVVVFDDARFDTEADMIRNEGGSLVHLTRGTSPVSAAHRSEHGPAPHPATLRIANDGGATPDQIARMILHHVAP